MFAYKNLTERRLCFPVSTVSSIMFYWLWALLINHCRISNFLNRKLGQVQAISNRMVFAFKSNPGNQAPKHSAEKIRPSVYRIKAFSWSGLDRHNIGGGIVFYWMKKMIYFWPSVKLVLTIVINNIYTSYHVSGTLLSFILQQERHEEGVVYHFHLTDEEIKAYSSEVN